jgi:hypothetical protein
MTPLLWQQHREQVPHAPPLSNNSSAKISRTITRCCQRVLSQRQAEEPDDDDDEMNPIKNGDPGLIFFISINNYRILQIFPGNA